MLLEARAVLPLRINRMRDGHTYFPLLLCHYPMTNCVRAQDSACLSEHSIGRIVIVTNLRVSNHGALWLRDWQ